MRSDSLAEAHSFGGIGPTCVDYSIEMLSIPAFGFMMTGNKWKI
jgi:hypothetical protein